MNDPFEEALAGLKDWPAQPPPVDVRRAVQDRIVELSQTRLTQAVQWGTLALCASTAATLTLMAWPTWTSQEDPLIVVFRELWRSLV